MVKIEKFAVIENAGYQREVVRAKFETYIEASKWMLEAYSLDEVDHLHVDIAMIEGDGSFTYDF